MRNYQQMSLWHTANKTTVSASKTTIKHKMDVEYATFKTRITNNWI